MKQLEHKEQATLIEWWAILCRERGYSQDMLFAIPNGGARNAITGAMLKAEGVRRGIPDLFLAMPSCCFHGLFIEMKKTKGGVVSEYQKNIHEQLRNQGYDVAICKGWAEARQVICEYLGVWL